MDIKKIRETADVYSAKLSEIARQLSFAGIAIIWIFKIGDSAGGMVYSGELRYPMACFITSLLLDLAHYLYSTIAWTAIGDCMDRNNQTKRVISNKINWIPNFLFYTKIMAVILGHSLILKNLISQF